MFKNIITFAKREIVLSISFLLALLSMLVVPPNRNYLTYIDYRTLAILFSLMAIMAGLQKLLVFRQLGELLIGKVSSLRGVSVILVLLCFFLSMFITNDVALITFVPFTIIVLNMSGQEKWLIPLIVLETIAANLGSMMMPMGNPQNLYLYSLSGMSLREFILLMLPYGALSLLLLLALCFFLTAKAETGSKENMHSYPYRRSKRERICIYLYLILFVLSLLVVVRVLNYWIGLAIVLVTIFFMDREILKSVDDTLLLTFFFLFIFIGNLKCIPQISSLLSSIVEGNEVLTGLVASQFISNVPAAILLSGFTTNIGGLILGTNFGGLGTLIASMASLISFKQYANTKGANKGRYLAVFTLLNLGMLGLLLLLWKCLT